MTELSNLRWVSVLTLHLLAAGSAQASLQIGLTAAAEPAPEPNRFQVSLRWQTPASETEFEIVRSRPDGSEEKKLAIRWLLGVPGFGPRPGRDQVYVDDEVSPATTYRYTVRPRHGTESQLESVEVKVPGNELEIQGRQKLADLDWTRRPIHRLILRQGAELVTEGRDLNVQLIELISEDATILTFPEDSVAPPGQPGRPGGSISIHAIRGSGKLTILGRGERGGKGGDGGQGPPGDRGQPGRPSVSSFKIVRPFPVEIEHICVASAGGGQRGGTGRTGLQGSKGLPGGDSAKIEVFISELPAPLLEARSIPGKGGEGGAGGPGGEGGEGGEGGAPSTACPLGPPGLPGDRGPQGPQGEEGETGKRLSCCVKIHSTPLDDCRDCQ